MKIIELAQHVKNHNREKLGKMNERKIALIIKETLSYIQQEVNNEENNVVRIPILGKFKPVLIEKEEDNKKILIKRVIFKPNMKGLE